MKRVTDDATSDTLHFSGFVVACERIFPEEHFSVPAPIWTRGFVKGLFRSEEHLIRRRHCHSKKIFCSGAKINSTFGDSHSFAVFPSEENPSQGRVLGCFRQRLLDGPIDHGVPEICILQYDRNPPRALARISDT